MKATTLSDTLALWPELEREEARARGSAITVAHLYRSEGHNYFGHYQRAPGTEPMLAEPRLNVVAGAGIVGDRFFQKAHNYSGQVTFFAEETWQRLGETLGGRDRGPEVFRRNIITRGVDLLSLVGREFEIQGVRFFGTEHCKPCSWMDHAYAPGALAKLAEWRAGGLRAKVLTDGWISVSAEKEVPCLAR